AVSAYAPRPTVCRLRQLPTQSTWLPSGPWMLPLFGRIHLEFTRYPEFLEGLIAEFVATDWPLLRLSRALSRWRMENDQSLKHHRRPSARPRPAQPRARVGRKPSRHTGLPCPGAGGRAEHRR